MTAGDAVLLGHFLGLWSSQKPPSAHLVPICKAAQKGSH